MIIKKVSVSCFKSVKYVEVEFQNFTPILGANNAGKSTILRAIDVFFDPAPKIDKHDHFKSDPNIPILITVTFGNLTPTECDAFKGSIINNEITITREVSSSDRHGGYAIYRKSHPDFQDFYNQTSKSERRRIYSDLRRDNNLLPTAANADDCEASLLAYEAAHEDELVATRMRGFLGAVNIANGIIKRKTNYIVVPAVKDGGDLDSEKTSPIVSLLNSITRQTLENKLDLQSYLKEAKENIESLANPEEEPMLSSIGNDITGILKGYYSDAAVEASWDKTDIIQINYPRATISVSHRGVDLPIQSLGHGLQRILIFSVLQYLAKNQNDGEGNDLSGEGFSEPLSDIIIAIEEPEIYQHPIKQRQIYKNIRSLVEGFDKVTGIRIQVIFTTHSEKMVAISDFDSLRLIRKKEVEGEYETVCCTCKIEECSKILAEMQDPPVAPFSNEKFLASLHIFTDEISEGFFADRIVLVEGVSDKAILAAAYLSRGRSADDDGIAIIRTDGKTKLEKPALIFKKFGMPLFLLFDGDKKGVKDNEKINKRLQIISEASDPVEYPDGCFSNFCVFSGNLNDYIDKCLGDQKEKIYQTVCAMWNLSPSEVAKSPNVISSLFMLAREHDIEFPMLDDIIDRVDAL